MKKDTDLDTLRGRPDDQAVLRRIEQPKQPREEIAAPRCPSVRGARGDAEMDHPKKQPIPWYSHGKSFPSTPREIVMDTYRNRYPRFMPKERLNRHLLRVEHLEGRFAPATYYPLPGDNTLGNAIAAAQANPDSENTIELAAGSYTATQPMVIQAANKTLIITGAGMGQSLIHNTVNTQHRIFEIVGAGSVRFAALTITGGYARDGGSLGGDAALGGGLLIVGPAVTLDHVSVSGNSVHGRDADPELEIGEAGGDASGGGLYLASGQLTLRDCVVSENIVVGGRGGRGFPGSGLFSRPGQDGADGESGEVGASGIPGSGPGVRGSTGGAGMTGTDGENGGNAEQSAFGGGGPGGTGGSARGGGIYFAGGNVSILNTRISTNQVLGGAGGEGGAALNLFEAILGGRGGAGGPGGGGGGGGFGGSGSRFPPPAMIGPGGDGGSGGPGALGGYGGDGGDGAEGYVGGLGGRGGDGLGGGLFLGNGTVVLTSTTLQGNSAFGGDGGDGGAAGLGGQGGDGGRGGGGGFGGSGASGGDAFWDFDPFPPYPGANGGWGVFGAENTEGATGGAGNRAGDGGDGGHGGEGSGGGFYVANGNLTCWDLVVTQNEVHGSRGGMGVGGGVGGNGGTGGQGGGYIGEVDAGGAGGSAGSGGWLLDYGEFAFIPETVYLSGSAGLAAGGARGADGGHGGDAGDGGAGGLGGVGGDGTGGGITIAGGNVALGNAQISNNHAFGGDGNQGGYGGGGGQGGDGGTGGQGGFGGSGGSTNGYNISASAATPGAEGGDGGDGGTGGNGANGGNGAGGGFGGNAYGGGVYVRGGHATQSGATFNTNTVSPGEGGLGGTVGAAGVGGVGGSGGQGGFGGPGGLAHTLFYLGGDDYEEFFDYAGTGPDGLAGFEGDVGADGQMGGFGLPGGPGEALGPNVYGNLDEAPPPDTTPPVSSVTSLSLFSPATFVVTWSGSDEVGGSGLASFDIYVRDNDGAFIPLLTNTTLTATSFTGVDGHTYGFYSVATDQAGNRQATPATAQASTTIDGSAPASAVDALPSSSPTTFLVSWSGTDGTGSGLASFDVFVRDNNGPFMTLLSATTQTSFSFTGLAGHTYRFYSVARDNAGNLEAAPPVADAVTTVDGGSNIFVGPDPVDPAQSALFIFGTPAQDSLLISSVGTNSARVILNGNLTTWSGIVRVIAYGQGGDDVMMATGSSIPVWLFGEAGSDTLFGTYGNDLLSGGTENDVLYGLSGDDVLLGGSGSDVIFGGSGEDLVVAGATLFDGDRSALALIVREWNSGRSYETRVQNLRGDPNPLFGQRLNGEVFLRAMGPGATVFDDHEVDYLSGNAGRDWFFASLEGPTMDSIWIPELNEWIERLP